MKNIIENDTPATMVDVTVKTLCKGSLTPSNMSKNFSDHLYDNLVSHFNIDPVSLNKPYPTKGIMKQIFDYGCLSSVKLEGWIESFTHRYSLSCIKLVTLANRLTDEPELIMCLSEPGLTVHSLRVCHGKLMRKKYPDGADQMIKKRVQMFHDTAQEWCVKVNEFMETCDKKAPMLYRCERVNFF
jgi:hypothetical protein